MKLGEKCFAIVDADSDIVEDTTEWLPLIYESAENAPAYLAKTDEHKLTPVVILPAAEVDRLRADNAKLREALKTAEAALADIGDAEREPGDNMAWCERRAKAALPMVREVLASLIKEQNQ